MMKETGLGEPTLCGIDCSHGTRLGQRCRATRLGDAVEWQFPPETLSGLGWLYQDFVFLSSQQVCLRIELKEAGATEGFFMTFAPLRGVRSRLRLPFSALKLNAWALFREEGLLKRCCYGQPVDPARVTMVRLSVERMAEEPVEWEMGELCASKDEPLRLKNTDLWNGPLVDPFGQSRVHDWQGRTVTKGELVARLRAQRETAHRASWPAGFSRWGGWQELQFAATGWFRLQQDDRRWWLVDPDGYAYWSAAMDCVRMGSRARIDGLTDAIEDSDALFRDFADCVFDTGNSAPTQGRDFDFVRANLMRAFGEEAELAWGQITISILRQTGFNGFGNWSDSQLASHSRFPYVHPLNENFRLAPRVFRDFPDVWHPDWQADLAAYVEPLRKLRDDPALIGYFLMNEPKWGFAAQTIAEGMLLNAPPCPARMALADFLRERHGSDEALAAKWQMPVNFDAIATGPNIDRFTPGSQSDLSDFSTIMAERFFNDLSAACKAVDPHHLNLGVRYYTIPPQWLSRAMRGFDVFSLNAYEDAFPTDKLAMLYAELQRPMLIGEWHHGALDVGLPMAGICRVADQSGRGLAYQAYLESAAAQPWCVGAHYFQLYDQPFLGRFDGENWNIGLLDICNRVHEPFAAGVLAAHQRMYSVAAGRIPPTTENPPFRPRHFV